MEGTDLAGVVIITFVIATGMGYYIMRLILGL